MKKMTLKGKITTGVVAASIIGSSTFAFATSNAGSELTAWGNTQVTNAKMAVTAAIGASRTTKVGQFASESNAKKDTSKGNIDTAGTKEKTETVGAIQTKLNEHVDSLNAALEAFLAAIGADFDQFVTTENTASTKAFNTQHTALDANINTVLKAAKESNVKDVTEASLLAKGKATSDLIKRINEVKADLAARVELEKTTAQREVDAHLLAEYNRVTGLINTLITGLEADARLAIETAGSVIEQSSYANFDRVIEQIKDNNPIKVDHQKLEVFNKLVNGKIEWTVENKNMFDVVYTWKHVALGAGGVSETVYATGKSEASRGKSIFYTPQSNKDGKVIIEWLDHNGVKQTAEKNEPNNPNNK